MFHDILTFEISIRGEMNKIRRSFTSIVIRKDIMFTHASFFSLISRAIMTTLIRKRLINIPRMVIRGSTKLRNNITDLCTLEILYDIVISKNMKMDSFASKV
jgi:hypothetical protein